MGLHGKLVAAIEFKAGDDVFHQMFTTDPNDFSNACPEKVHGCELIEGEFGKVGTIINWTYTHDGKKKTGKEVITAIDEEQKLISFKLIEGDLMELYKSFVITCHVEKKGEDIDLVTWTFDYEKLNEDVEHPLSLLEYFIILTKETEAHHLAKKAN